MKKKVVGLFSAVSGLQQIYDVGYIDKIWPPRRIPKRPGSKTDLEHHLDRELELAW